MLSLAERNGPLLVATGAGEVALAERGSGEIVTVGVAGGQLIGGNWHLPAEQVADLQPHSRRLFALATVGPGVYHVPSSFSSHSFVSGVEVTSSLHEVLWFREEGVWTYPSLSFSGVLVHAVAMTECGEQGVALLSDMRDLCGRDLSGSGSI